MPGAADPLLTPDRIVAIKTLVAIACGALLAWGIALRRGGRPAAHRRLRDGLLLALGAMGILCWSNLLKFHFQSFPIESPLGYVHVYDTFHYYAGSKYFPELGYTRLYDCLAAADLEVYSRREIAQRLFRNLETNRIERPKAVLSDPSLCSRHFSPERWEAFQRDLDWFRPRIHLWDNITFDWGYNPPPVWTLAGMALTNTGPASRVQIGVLALLDFLLLGIMWGLVAWAFGWRATCVALVFWGTSVPSSYLWVGGGLLRQGWLVTSVAGICLLRRHHTVSAGFLFGYAALLRIFPGLVLAALGLKALWRAWRSPRWRLAPDHARVAAGALLSIAILVPLSTVATGGFDSWQAFFRNSVTDSRPAFNQMGLKAIVSHRGDANWEALMPMGVASYDAWRAAREGAFRERRLVFAALVLACLVPVALAVAREEDWVGAVLGLGMLSVVFLLQCYYYAALLVFGLLWTRRESIGVALCGLAAYWGVVKMLSDSFDVVYVWFSLGAVAFVVYAAVALLRSEDGEAQSPR
jgi:hypothetical protein